MVTAIRIYIEGGGDKKEQKAMLRKGFSKFLESISNAARHQNIGWNIIICGTRSNAFRDFRNGLKSHPEAVNILLVDAEAPVKKVDSPWQHLKSRDNWDRPVEINDDFCHLMVQTMEAWLLADIDNLKKFYGQGFQESAIPKTNNIETIEKDKLESSLKIASRHTSKGEYHKINHASKLLESLDVDKVRQASRYCDRLFTTLKNKFNIGKENSGQSQSLK
jgi:hypothetical protein